MTLLVLVIFTLTLYYAQNKHRVVSPISNKRRNWSYFLGIVGVAQLLMGFTHEPKHLFIGAFVGAWAWFSYQSRNDRNITVKKVIKTIILLFSSFTYLYSVNQPKSWEPLVIQSVLLVIVYIFQNDGIKIKSLHKIFLITKTNNTENNIVSNQCLLVKISFSIVLLFVGVLLCLQLPWNDKLTYYEPTFIVWAILYSLCYALLFFYYLYLIFSSQSFPSPIDFFGFKILCRFRLINQELNRQDKITILKMGILFIVTLLLVPLLINVIQYTDLIPLKKYINNHYSVSHKALALYMCLYALPFIVQIYYLVSFQLKKWLNRDL